MFWKSSYWLPPQGSAFSNEVDVLYMALFWLSVFFFVGITGAAVYFAWRYRYQPGRVTPHMTHNTPLEIIWTVIPLVLCVIIFFWGMDGFMKYAIAPGEALEIQVTAKKWLWQFEYPDGTRSVNEIHIPVDKNVRFVMTSEDVLHDFYVPDMRVKHDIVPGRYTEIWFRPTVIGEHHATCAEYCGKGHSDMQAKVMVDTPEKFADWMATGGDEWKNHTPEDWGRIQYEQKGCQTCHNVDGTKSKGPSWKGIYGNPVKVKTSDGKEITVIVDDNYIRESMMVPGAKVVDGFDNIMPTFQGLLRENEIRGLLAYIKSLK